MGAGPSPDGGYSADNLRENPYNVSSPQIMAGFIPFNNTILEDLYTMYHNDIGVYNLPNGKKILWRTSASDRAW